MVVVAVVVELPANVVAVWSQSGVPIASSDPVTGPLSCGDGGAPRGVRTPNRQIRSHAPASPASPSHPSASALVLVDGHVAGPGRTSVPAYHVRDGGNVVAVSGRRRQTGRLATGRHTSLLAQSTRFLIWCSWGAETQMLPMSCGSVVTGRSVP